MTFLIFLGILSVLVLIHEFGHFIVAVLSGIRVEEFAFGLPFTRPLVSIKIKNTKFSIYPLMFGGFVKLYGEEGSTEHDKAHSFWGKSKFTRIAVIGAGVVMNLFLALGAFGLLYSILGVPTATKEKVTVLEILPDSPASLAGFQVNDRVVAVEGKQIGNTKEFSDLMKSWAGLGVNVTLERGSGVQLFEGIAEKDTQTLVVHVIPRVNPPKDQGALGVAITEVQFLEMRRCNLADTACIGAILSQGVTSTKIWIARVFDGFRTIGQSLADGDVPKDVSGPVGIYKLTGIVAGFGFWPLVELTAILSVNLAVFNILPIPALDGGRVLFILIEWVRGKRLSADFEQKVNSWGMAILLILIALITLQDVINLDIFKSIFGSS